MPDRPAGRTGMNEQEITDQRRQNEEAARACAEKFMQAGPAKSDTVRKMELELAFLHGAVYGVSLAKVKP